MTDSSASHETTVRGLLSRVYGARGGSTDGPFISAGMSVTELVQLYGLVRKEGCRDVLEVGMSSGTSSVVICAALDANGGGQLTSVDPFQSDPAHAGNSGMQAVGRAGFTHLHRLVEEPDYTALPALVGAGLKYDLVFVDGWHSFDYTFVDLFYADLLLRDGGIVAVHDTTAAPVHKALRFFECHKPYERLSPPLMVELPGLQARVRRRVKTMFSGRDARREARARREEWRMLAAYRKTASTQLAEDALQNF